MKISDEQLSAFLDAELPEAEMELIREQLIEDENLANRLAELAMVDEIVAKAYATIDEQPLPTKITRLLANGGPQTAQVIEFPLWKRIRRGVQQYPSIAAGFLLVLGLALIQSFQKSGNDNWQQVAQVLETQPSGVEQVIKGTHVKPRLTFKDKNGNYCRQFDVIDSKTASENIACRKSGQWQLTISVAMEKVQESGNYQTATGGSLLDSAVEDMVAGDLFDTKTETDAINQHWSN